MAVIDRPAMLAHAHMYLPPENVLSDTMLLDIIESVILRVGDDDEYYSEILCKVLQTAAILNRSQTSISAGTVKREKSHGREVEWFQGTTGPSWDAYLDSLPLICPLLPGGGYELRSSKSFGFYANVADPVNVPKCSPPYGVTRDED